MDLALGGDMNFQFFHRWFNGLFLASASVALLVFYLQVIPTPSTAAITLTPLVALCVALLS